METTDRNFAFWKGDSAETLGRGGGADGEEERGEDLEGDEVPDGGLVRLGGGGVLGQLRLCDLWLVARHLPLATCHVALATWRLPSMTSP